MTNLCTPTSPMLLADIATAHRIEQPPEPVYRKTIEEELEEIERWIEGEEPAHTFSLYQIAMPFF